jgi:hypothetical protein
MDMSFVPMQRIYDDSYGILTSSLRIYEEDIAIMKLPRGMVHQKCDIKGKSLGVIRATDDLESYIRPGKEWLPPLYQANQAINCRSSQPIHSART